MTENVVRANGVDICTQSFGNPGDPPLLLIMGAMASMVWWPEEFCRLLADGGRYVIRFDNRDTGKSVTYPPGPPGYSLGDLAGDAVGVLDALKIPRAHFIGASLGGAIAQIAALTHSHRVESLTLIMSSPVGRAGTGLPEIEPGILEYHDRAMTLDWLDEASVIDYVVEGFRLTTGSAHAFDEATIRSLAREDFKRAKHLLSMYNHGGLSAGSNWKGGADDIRVPTLVIHGTEDPVRPFPHGKALAQCIPGARLLTLPGTGHEIHREDWPAIVDAILKHTAP